MRRPVHCGHDQSVRVHHSTDPGAKLIVVTDKEQIFYLFRLPSLNGNVRSIFSKMPGPSLPAFVRVKICPTRVNNSKVNGACFKYSVIRNLYISFQLMLTFLLSFNKNQQVKCVCKDHRRDKIKVPDPIVKDLISSRLKNKLNKFKNEHSWFHGQEIHQFFPFWKATAFLFQDTFFRTLMCF